MSEDKISKDAAFAIHFAIHDPSIKTFNVDGRVLEIVKNKSGCRTCTYKNVTFMEQNLKKSSKYAQMAKRGDKITWIPKGGAWGRIINNKIEVLPKEIQVKEDEDREYHSDLPVTSDEATDQEQEEEIKMDQTLDLTKQESQVQTPVISRKNHSRRNKRRRVAAQLSPGTPSKLSPTTANSDLSPLPISPYNYSSSPKTSATNETPVRSRRNRNKRRRVVSPGNPSP